MGINIPNEVYVYIAREKCGCITAVTVDNPERRKDIAKDLADFIKSDRTVERMSLTDFKAAKFGCNCKGKKEQLELLPGNAESRV